MAEGYRESRNAFDNPSCVSEALNRIADALFQQAKAHREQVKVSAKQLAVAESMAQMQKANLAVTKHLEVALAEQAGVQPHGSA